MVAISLVTPNRTGTNNNPGLHRQVSQRSSLSLARGRGARSRHSADDLLRKRSEEVPDYPEDEIRLAVERLPNSVKQMFELRNATEDTLNVSYRTHTIDSVEGEPVCATQRVLWEPRRPLNPSDDYIYIVNLKDYKQTIYQEVCVNRTSRCSELGQVEETMECVQKYSRRVILHYNKKLGETFWEPVVYKSCCSCHVKYEGGALDRRNQAPPISLNTPPDVSTKEDPVEKAIGGSSSFVVSIRKANEAPLASTESVK